MNRRSIFKLFASATLAAATEVRGLVPLPTAKVYRRVVNPEYLTAAFEDIYIYNGPPVMLKGVIDAGLPTRYNFVDGKYVEVPYFKIHEEEVPV